MMMLALVAVVGFLAGACDGDGGEEEDADADAEVIDDGREDVPGDPPVEDGGPEDPPIDDGVPDEVTPDAEEDPDMDAADVPDAEEDVEEEEVEPPVDCDSIHESITAAGLLVHLTALDDIATDNGSNRAPGTGGWDDSVTYVQDELEAAGYTVTQTTIEYPYYTVEADPALDRTAPDTHTYTYASDDETPVGDFQKVNLSRPGEVTAEVTPVDLDLGADNTSTSGCEAADFSTFTSGHIALIQRGTCYFTQKALNAQAAGASGVLLFNQGNTPAREGLMAGGVAIYPLDSTYPDPDHGVTIPVLFATYAVGVDINTTITSGTSVSLHMDVNTIYEIRETQNVFTETSGGNADEVVMFGAHLDSVPEAPGINDNGSGVAAVLEIARVVSGCDVTRKMRFAFWGAEETGQWGSVDYVFGLLASDELGQIYGYFNVDMIGSPNYSIFVYDGDGSTFGWPGAVPSDGIEQFFQSDMFVQGLATFPVFTDLSDHFFFLVFEVPYGGLFSGAGDLKTAEEVAAFGGTEGEPHDSCYHHSCDTLSNVDMDIAEVMSKSLGRAAQFFGVDGMDAP